MKNKSLIALFFIHFIAISLFSQTITTKVIDSGGKKDETLLYAVGQSAISSPLDIIPKLSAGWIYTTIVDTIPPVITSVRVIKPVNLYIIRGATLTVEVITEPDIIVTMDISSIDTTRITPVYFSQISPGIYQSSVPISLWTTAEDGPKISTVAVIDNQGNISIATFSVTLDNTAPTVSIISPTGSIGPGLTTVEVKSDEILPTSPTVILTLNGRESEDVTSLLTTPDSGYTWTGNYTVSQGYKGLSFLKVKAIDYAGFWGYTTGTFIVEGGPTPDIEISNLINTPDPFHPTGINNVVFEYTLDRKSPQYTIQWSSITVTDPFENTVTQFTADGVITYPETVTQVWNGTTNSDIVPDGIYSYTVTAGGIRQWGNPKNPKLEYVEASPKAGTITILKRIEFIVDPATIYINPSNPTFIITPLTSTETARTFGITLETVDKIIGSAYKIEPTNVLFSIPAILKLYYDEPLPAGVNEEDLRIYRFELGIEPIILSGPENIDIMNNCITIQVSKLSVFAILSPGAIFVPPEEIDLIPPKFIVSLIISPEKTDELTIKVTASEPLISSPKAIVIPHGNLEQRARKQPIEIQLESLNSSTTEFISVFRNPTGFGDVESIIVIGKDLSGNEGRSDGSYIKNIISSAGGRIKGPNGAEIVIPPGALENKTTINIMLVEENNNDKNTKKKISMEKQNLKPIGYEYNFEPSGIQ